MEQIARVLFFLLSLCDRESSLAGFYMMSSVNEILPVRRAIQGNLGGLFLDLEVYQLGVC